MLATGIGLVAGRADVDAAGAVLDPPIQGAARNHAQGPRAPPPGSGGATGGGRCHRGDVRQQPALGNGATQATDCLATMAASLWMVVVRCLAGGMGLAGVGLARPGGCTGGYLGRKRSCESVLDASF